MIRLVVIFDPEFNGLPPEVREYADQAEFEAGVNLADLARAPDISSFSVQRVSDWFPATWRQLLPGDEVLGELDGRTWVVARGLSPVSPHEVELYLFGDPERRFTLTPRYDAPVKARRPHESQMLALLMTELGARVIDDGKV